MSRFNKDGEFVDFYSVTGSMSRRLIDLEGEYLKKIPAHYRGIKDLIHSYEGRFTTTITVTFTGELLQDINKAKESLNRFTNTLQKYIKTQGDCSYIGVLEHGEGLSKKNPIEPHYHFLIDCFITKKRFIKWKKEGKRKWGLNLWFDIIKNQSDMRFYVSKYAKGKNICKDYENPTHESWLAFENVKRSRNYTSKLRNKVHFSVEKDLLDFFGYASNRYLYNEKVIRKFHEPHKENVSGVIPVIHLQDIDWSMYEEVEILYLLKKKLIRDFYKNVLLDDKYFNDLISIFSTQSNLIYIINKLSKYLDTVTLLDARSIQVAHDSVLKGLDKIPKRYKWRFIFSFKEWTNITNAYFWKGENTPSYDRSAEKQVEHLQYDELTNPEDEFDMDEEFFMSEYPEDENSLEKLIEELSTENMKCRC